MGASRSIPIRSSVQCARLRWAAATRCSAAAKAAPRAGRSWHRWSTPQSSTNSTHRPIWPTCWSASSPGRPKAISCTNSWPGTGRLPKRASRRRPHEPASPSGSVGDDGRRHVARGLRGRAERRPVATSMPMLDGYVAAIVAGPVSISPLDWICPLLAIDADAFNHGGTAAFAAISAVVQHHNAISNTLSNTPTRFEPIHLRKPNGDVDARPWCVGFHAAMQQRLSAWAPLLDTRNINHGLLLPILLHCVDDQGHPLLGPTRKGPKTEDFLRDAHTDIPAVVEAMRQYWMPIRYARTG